MENSWRFVGDCAAAHHATVLYRFDQFELDTSRVELRSAGGVALAVEPQVFALLTLLVENRHRMVSRDEIIEKVWDGRIVSDAAIASPVVRTKIMRSMVDTPGIST